MTILEMLIVLAVMTFFVLGIVSPFLVGTKDEAMEVMAKNMEGDLNNHYNHWLSAGGILEGRPKTSDLLMLFSSNPGSNKTIISSDDKNSAVKDAGYSNLVRLNLPADLKPKANEPSSDVVASPDYVVRFNSYTSQFNVTATGGTNPTTGGTNPGPDPDPGPGGGTDPGPGGGTDPGPGGGTDPGTGPGGGGIPPKPNEPHQQEGEFSAYTWVAAKGTPSQYVYTSIRVPAYAPSTHAAQSKLIKEGHVAIFATNSSLWTRLEQNPADKIKNPDGTPTSYQDPWMAQGIKDIRDGIDPSASGGGSANQGVDEWFRNFASAGGKADYIVCDWEGYYEVPGPGWSIDLAKADALYNDPRFPSIADSLPASTSQLIQNTPNIPTRQQYVFALTGLAQENFGKAVLQPARKYFPKAHTSNYFSYIMTPANTQIWNNGSPGAYFSKKAGTDNAPSMYGGVYQTFATLYGNQGFIRVLWLLNTHRGIQRSSPDPVTPWMAPCSFSEGSPPCPAFVMPYYKEIVYHFALSGANAIFGWNPYASQTDDEGFGDAMNNVNSKIGTGWRYPLSLADQGMTTTLIVSGMKLESGKTVYRVTVKKPDSDLSSVKTVNVSNGDTITVGAGEVGAWYESATGQLVTFSAAP